MRAQHSTRNFSSAPSSFSWRGLWPLLSVTKCRGTVLEHSCLVFLVFWKMYCVWDRTDFELVSFFAAVAPFYFVPSSSADAVCCLVSVCLETTGLIIQANLWTKPKYYSEVCTHNFTITVVVIVLSTNK